MSAKHLVREPRPLTVAKGRCFIDTNVLVYAHANDEPLKQARALALLGQLHGLGRAVLSTQVLQEFCNVALKKLGMKPLQVQTQLLFCVNWKWPWCHQICWSKHWTCINNINCRFMTP